MLFKNTSKLIEYCEVTASTNFATVKPSIKRIEDNHLLPILGAEQYNELNDAYTEEANESELPDESKALLDKCREVIGSYLGYYFTPIAELKLSDAGVRRSETASEKTAFQYQVNNFKEASLKNGEIACENLLQFLEENKEDYDEWVDSEAFKNYRSLFIKSGKEFNEHFTSHSPYRNYWAVRNKMVEVEELHIRKALGAELYDYLKEKNAESTPAFTNKETILLTKLKNAIANFAVAFAIPFLSVRIDANGITVATSGARTSRDEDATRQTAPDLHMGNIINAAKEAGKNWLAAAIEYLNDNADDFPGWEAEDEADEDNDINNDLNGSFFL